MKMATLFSIAGHTVLALAALCMPSLCRSGPIQTAVSTLAIAAGSSDSDASVGGNAESHVERSIGGGLWAASALAESGGNLEVGVTATRSFVVASSQAHADLSLTQRYGAGDARVGGVRFTVQPGEIVVRSDLSYPFAGDSTAHWSLGWMRA